MGGHTQGAIPASSNLGITKFVLFGIDNTVGTCNAQMLAGSFSDYGDLDPVKLSEITTTTFPCLKVLDNIEVTTAPVDNCASLVTPAVDTATMSSDIVTNSIDICIRVGAGFVASGLTKYYAMAALVGSSPDPSDTDEYVLAIEQFPVMVKTSTVTFRFLWTVYI